MKICIIGLGYVGKALFNSLNKTNHKIIGYDIDALKCTNNNITNDIEKIKKYDVFIVCVPTPLKTNQMDDTYLINVINTLNNFNNIHEKTVIFESTISVEFYDIIKNTLKTKKIGYSPERLSPTEFDINEQTKIVSANNEKTLKIMKSIYNKITKLYIIDDYENGIKKAILAKLMENSQRAINISLMNEFKANYPDIFDDALNAASTKSNFIKYTPGLIGGQCIAMDPHFTNCENMKSFLINTESLIFDYLINQINKIDKNGSIIIFGASYKKNSGDITYSKNMDLINKLKSFKSNVFVYDPIANIKEKTTFTEDDILIKLVNHDIFDDLDLKYDIILQ